MDTAASVPHVNGVPLTSADESLDAPTLRARAHCELLRQAAIADGLLAADDPVPERGVPSEAASLAIEAWLDRHVPLPEPDEAACRRYFEAHAGHFSAGEQVHLRHILFAVTAGVDLAALRKHAEATLIDLRAVLDGEQDRFATVAASLSNCPSGAQGGELGWLTRDDCVPEFARAVFGQPAVGVLPHLVHSRFGLHVVEVRARRAGACPAFDMVQPAVARTLQQRAWAEVVRHLLSVLAGQADVRGVDLGAATSPLLQ